MGPRPGGRGEAIDLGVEASAHAASMGPRPGGRGESRSRTNPNSATKLQWGRAPEGAESRASGGGRRREDRFNGAAPRRARRARDGQRYFRVHLASMGPRPGGRGEFSTSFSGDSIAKLQWGRAPEGAERCAARSPQACATSFNGAAPRRARRGGRCAGSARTGAGFNGAAPRRARRARISGAHPNNQLCFNGAAPRRARRGR